MSLPTLQEAEAEIAAAVPDVLPFSPAPPPAAIDSVAVSSTANGVIRALHVINGEHYSGAERVQDLLAGQLPNFGCEVGFVCVKPKRFESAREFKDAPLVDMPMRGRFDLRIVRKLVALVQHNEYDLIHAHTPRTAIVGSLAARRAGVPFVYHVHSPAGRDSTRQVLNWINANMEWAAVRKSARLITVSNSLRNYMIGRGLPAEQLTCVPNGVPLTGGISERRAPTGCWTLGTIALFRPRKGTEVLLEALALLKSREINVRLRAVGGFETPAYESATLALAERLGLDESIDWTGFTRNVTGELAQIDLFVLPSLFGEGLPMVVLEAMAAGVPVVATRVEGVPDAVVHRQTGLLVDAASVSQLARGIEEIINGKVDYATLSRGARVRHAELFSDRAMAGGVAGVYREVLAARNQAT